MTTLALDMTTFADALQMLKKSFLGNVTYHPVNHDQRTLVGWNDDHGDEVRELTQLKSLAATSADPLNALLKENGFDIRLDPFQPGDIGAVSILDMIVRWINAGKPGAIWSGGKSYPAFQLDSNDVQMYSVPEQTEPLVRLRTESGDDVWLIKPNQAPRSNFEASMLAQRTASSRKEQLYNNRNIVVPNLEIDIQPDMSSLIGMGIESSLLGHFMVSQVLQQFKLRMNARGARAKVATAVAVTRGMGPVHYLFDQPFVFYMTQKGHEGLALAPVFADTDVWKDSGESLEDL
jgi:hypothetical protein